MKYLTRPLALVSSLFLLAGCASQPESINYYLLHSPEQIAALSKPESQQRIVLQSLDLAEYLQNRHIVMQLASNKLQFSNKHRWAENLHTGVEKALLNSLNRQSKEALYLSRKQLGDEKAIPLFVELTHFLITENSKAIVSGNFWFKGEQLDAGIHSFHITRDLSNDGYPHAIEQLRASIEELAKHINMMAKQPSS